MTDDNNRNMEKENNNKKDALVFNVVAALCSVRETAGLSPA